MMGYLVSTGLAHTYEDITWAVLTDNGVTPTFGSVGVVAPGSLSRAERSIPVHLQAQQSVPRGRFILPPPSCDSAFVGTA